MSYQLKDAHGTILTFSSEVIGGHHQPINRKPPETRQIFSHYMDTVGDGSGERHGIGDYSGTAQAFKIKPSSDELLHVARIIIYIEDGAGMDNGKYGTGLVLNNGITLVAVVDGIAYELTGGLPIKTNGQWKRLCYDEHIDVRGGGNDSCAVRFTFTKAGDYLNLDGSKGDYLEVILHDDFTDLVDHTFLVQGYFNI